MHCDPNQKTVKGETPLFIISESMVIEEKQQKAIRLLLQHKAALPDPTWEKIYLHKPAEAFSKLFCIGFPLAGKSTLAKSLTTESANAIKIITNRFKQISGVEKDTCGIVPCDIQSNRFGSITIYDLAGHNEFYTSHDIALRSILAGSSSSIVILVADVSKSEEFFKQAILHWCSFASNLFDYSKSYHPFLIIIGSYADKARSDTIQTCKDLVESLKSKNIFKKFTLECFIPLDCRYSVSRGMTKLRSHVAECCHTIKESQIMHFRDHCFFVAVEAIMENFSDKLAITVNDLISAAEHPGNLTLESVFSYKRNQFSISDFCLELNKRGNLLFLRNRMELGKSWIVLQKEILLKRITGSIFTPKEHKDYKPLASNTGIVPASKLAEVFPDLDCDLIISLMIHFQFCHKVTDPEILKQLLISDHDNKYLFFPSLVTVAAPRGIWEDRKEFSYESVWSLMCSDDEQFLSTTFIHVTIHHFALKYAMAPRSTSASTLSIHRKCSVWKNGIFWQSLQGLDIIAELDCKKVALYIRARKHCEMKAVKLRSKLISTVLKIKQEYYKEANMIEYFVGNASITFPLRDDPVLVPLTDIVQSLINCMPYCFSTQDEPVEIHSLLHFEPFTYLDESIVDELFSSPEKDISNDFLSRFVEKMLPSMDSFITLLKVPPSANVFDSESVSKANKFYRVLEYWRDRNPHYSQLCAVLAEYSIFAGRNPLNLVN